MCAAWSKDAPTSPASIVRRQARLSPSDSWITSASSPKATSISVTTGRMSHSTLISSRASSASARVLATIATTGSPSQLAFLIASACCSADFIPSRCARTPTQGAQNFATSCPSTTATTPGALIAWFLSILFIRACA